MKRKVADLASIVMQNPERIIIVYANVILVMGKYRNPMMLNNLKLEVVMYNTALGVNRGAFGNVPHEWMCVPSDS